jgi:hypothetical protein
MIDMGFLSCPRFLWITLWESCCQARQVLDFVGLVTPCLISWQFDDINKINDLARISVTFRYFFSRYSCKRPAARLVGISQALSAHSQAVPRHLRVLAAAGYGL